MAPDDTDSSAGGVAAAGVVDWPEVVAQLTRLLNSLQTEVDQLADATVSQSVNFGERLRLLERRLKRIEEHLLAIVLQGRLS